MTTRSQFLTVKRDYKSRIFTMIFNDKDKLLELYNAISGRDYKDPELLTINTLDNAIYMSMKNDLSFIIDSRLSLYEHQSTYNPNMALRFFFYLADLYSAITKGQNLYGTKKVIIPPPKFIVFYNGREESCAILHNYAEYIYRIRKYSKDNPIEDAVDQAIDECIQEGILKEFLTQHRAEAKAMSIYEYNQEEHMRMERDDAFEDGRKEGFEAGLENGRSLMLDLLSKMIDDNIADMIPRLASEPEFHKEMVKKYIE